MSLEIHAISTTVSCSVSGGEGHLSAEVDSRSWGYNGGRSTYYAGDDCYVIVYKSSNLRSTLNSRCTGGVIFTQGPTDCGYNLKREHITFSSPIASASKPLKSNIAKVADNFSECSGPQYMPLTTVIRLKTWTPTLSITKAPPYGAMFIEYEPNSVMWKFSNLKRNPSLINTEVHAALFGLVEAKEISFVSF